jgi:hypothetical protein
MTSRCVSCERDKDEDLGFFGSDERFRCFRCGTDGKATREDILALEMNEKYEKKKEIVLMGETPINLSSETTPYSQYPDTVDFTDLALWVREAIEERNNGTDRD